VLLLAAFLYLSAIFVNNPLFIKTILTYPILIFFFIETGSCYVAQAGGLELEIFLPQSLSHHTQHDSSYFQ
jgi:hypothetical protein